MSTDTGEEPGGSAAGTGRGLDNVTMVTASAGTGKTYTVTDRIAGKLADGLRVDAVLATTFTKKAAGELKERVAAKLLDRAAHGGAAGLRLREAAQGLSAGLIGTVNGVCDQLLHEFAIDLGLSPELETIAEEEQAPLFAMAVDEILGASAVEHLGLLRRMEQPGGDGWEAEVRRICERARTNMIAADELRTHAGRSWEGFARLLPAPDGSDERGRWLQAARRFGQDLEAALASGVDGAGKRLPTEAANFKSAVPSVRALLGRLAEADPPDVPWDTWRQLAGSSGDPAWLKRMRAPLAAALQGIFSCPAFHDDVRTYQRTLFDCAADCLEAYARFKRRHGLVDFIDQETLVAQALESNAGFRDSFAQRVRYLVVDEFQDTSPLQLRLFLAMSGLVEEAVWVGDPKQAIYGFRGTDPALMEAVVARVPDSRHLGESWRSHRGVVDLANAVFVPVFERYGVPREAVAATLPAEHSHWGPGALHAWTLEGRAAEQVDALARGVRDFLAAHPAVRPGDLAVLVRTNDNVVAVADALDRLGVRASASGRPLLGFRETQLVRAGMAFVANAEDTLALAELVALLPTHASHHGWQEELLSAAEPGAVHARWAADPSLAGLAVLRGAAELCTPTEVLEAVVGALGVADLAKAWGNPANRLRNLDLLRGALQTYYGTCLALQLPGTLRGALAYLGGQEAAGAEDSGPDVVNVSTYHKAKGLEWAAVVAFDLGWTPSPGAFGTVVEKAPAFSLEDPLAGRWIRHWPNPFRAQANFLTALAEGSPELAAAAEESAADAARLFYVGLTRAKEHLVLACGPKGPAGLNALGVPGLVSWDDGGIRVAGAAAPFPAACLAVEADPSGPIPGADRTAFTDPAVAPPGTSPGTGAPEAGGVVVPSPAGFLPARIRASAAESQAAARVLPVADLGGPLVAGGGADWDKVGSAIHAYLGTAYAQLSPQERAGLAATVLARWGVDAVGPGVLVEAGDRLAAYLGRAFPGATVHTEAAIGWFTEESQTMEGWIDLLVETADGFVVVDHKSYPGTDPAGHIRAHYLGQLELYAQAVREATGRDVVAKLVHLPALGAVYEVTP